MLLAAVALITALVLYRFWPYRCPAGDPMCERRKPCMTCWKAGVAALQVGIEPPRLTQERKPREPEKLAVVRRAR